MNALKIISSTKGNIAFIFIISLLIWFPLFSIYWAQDDFWIVTDARNLTVHKLIAGTNEGFLRPVSTFWYPFVLQSIFGENPFVYHLINGIVFACTSVVVYLIANELTNNKRISLIAGAIFGTHLAHMFEQSWFSGAQDILASFFFVTSILFFLSGISRKNSLYYIISILTSALAIWSKESTIILPFIFLLYLIIGKYSVKNTLTRFIPYLVIVLIFGFMWLNFRIIPESGSYQPFLDFTIIKNLVVYLYWLAFPIVILIQSLFGGTSDYFFIKDHGNYLGIIFLSFLIVFIPIYVKKISKIKIVNKNIIHFLIISGFISLGPVVFLNHFYSYYLDYALVSFSIFIAILAEHIIKNFNIKRYLQILTFVALILLVQYTVIESLDHPAFDNPLPQLGKDSKQYSQLVMKSLGSIVGPKDTIYVINYSKHDYAAVMTNGIIFNYLFPNSSITVIPLNKTEQIPKNCDSECIILIQGYELTPTIIKNNR